MSRKKDDTTKSTIYILIAFTLFPFFLIYLTIKEFMNLINMFSSNKNTVNYKLKISSDDKELLEEIDNMEGHDFERFIAAILMKNQYQNVKITKGSGDFGADVLAEYNGIKYAIQCKRFDSKLGPKPIGEVLRGINYYKCDKGIVLTNNYFTKQAYIEANVDDVELWDRNKVLELCRNTKKNNEIKNKNEKVKTKKNIDLTLIKRYILTIFSCICFLFALVMLTAFSISFLFFLFLGVIISPQINEKFLYKYEIYKNNHILIGIVILILSLFIINIIDYDNYFIPSQIEIGLNESYPLNIKLPTNDYSVIILNNEIIDYDTNNIFAKQEGETIIEIHKNSEVVDTLKVKVKKYDLENFELKFPKNMKTNENITFDVKYYPQNAYNKNITYSCENLNITNNSFKTNIDGKYLIHAVAENGIEKNYEIEIEADYFELTKCKQEIKKIIQDCYNKEIFKIDFNMNSELSDISVFYYFQNDNLIKEEYEHLAKEEISKVYENLKYKKIYNNSIFVSDDKKDDNKVRISFDFAVKRSTSSAFYYATLEYNKNDLWNKSYENIINNTSLKQEDFDRTFFFLNNPNQQYIEKSK